MQKKIAKNWVLFVSGALSAIVLFMATQEPFKFCGETWRDCMHLNFVAVQTLFPIIPLFLFSLVTYFMRESVYSMWAKFAIPATLFSILAIFFTQDSSGGGFGPQLSFGKGDVALICGALFVLISLAIIAYGYLRPSQK